MAKINPMKPLPRKDSERRTYGPFSEILQNYVDAPLPEARVDSAHVHELTEMLFPNGRPVSRLNGVGLRWHVGLASLCSIDSDGNIGQLASQHASCLFQMYKKWREIDDDGLAEPKYSDRALSASPKLRGALLLPSLPIYDRERLSDTYIDLVLRPYARAKYECRQAFWEKLGRAHEAGCWLGFVPTSQGTFVPLLPGSGFDAAGSYAMDAQTYLKGMEYSADEVELPSWPRSSTRPDHDNWLFIEAGQLAGSFTPSLKEKTTRGRPKGTGYNDDWAVDEAIGLFKSGECTSISNAANTVVDRHPERIKGNSRDAKVERLRKKISKKLNQ